MVVGIAIRYSFNILYFSLFIFSKVCFGAGPSSSGSGSSSSSGGKKQTKQPQIYVNPSGSKSDRNCRYDCQSNGGCQVTYIGPPRAGQTSGSCFPDDFGGSCSGTPRECQDCNQALSCSSGGGSSSSGGSNSGSRPSSPSRPNSPSRPSTPSSPSRPSGGSSSSGGKDFFMGMWEYFTSDPPYSKTYVRYF